MDSAKFRIYLLILFGVLFTIFIVGYSDSNTTFKINHNLLHKDKVYSTDSKDVYEDYNDLRNIVDSIKRSKDPLILDTGDGVTYLYGVSKSGLKDLSTISGKVSEIIVSESVEVDYDSLDITAIVLDSNYKHTLERMIDANNTFAGYILTREPVLIEPAIVSRNGSTGIIRVKSSEFVTQLRSFNALDKLTLLDGDKSILLNKDLSYKSGYDGATFAPQSKFLELKYTKSKSGFYSITITK